VIIPVGKGVVLLAISPEELMLFLYVLSINSGSFGNIQRVFLILTFSILAKFLHFF
jgi:hypothetical protein